MTTSNDYLSPASIVIAVTVLLTALLGTELDAITVMEYRYYPPLVLLYHS